MELKVRDDYFKGHNADDLLFALSKNETHIIIQAGYKKEFLENTELPLSEKEQIGLMLGSRGMSAIWGEIIFQLLNRLGKGSKQQKEINRKIRKYKWEKGDENEILLYLRQLEY